MAPGSPAVASPAPLYAMQMTEREINHAGAEVKLAQSFDGLMVPRLKGEIAVNLGLWVAADEVTVLELRAEGWQVIETSVPASVWQRLDARLGRVRVRWIRGRRRVAAVLHELARRVERGSR